MLLSLRWPLKVSPFAMCEITPFTHTHTLLYRCRHWSEVGGTYRPRGKAEARISGTDTVPLACKRTF